MARLFLLLFGVLCVAPSARAAEVIGVGKNRKSVAVTHDGRQKWALDDRACVVQGRIDVVCGTVAKATSRGAIIKLDTAFEAVSVGDRVRRSPVGRRPATKLLDSIPSDSRTTRPHRFNLSAGISAGLSFFFPLIHLQAAVVPSLAVGVQPVYFKYSGTGVSGTAIGGYLTLNYYGARYFRGLWGQLAGGLVNLKLSGVLGEESASKPAVVALIGWRGHWDFGLNVGIGAGIQYLGDPEFSQNISARGVQPLVALDIGIGF